MTTSPQTPRAGTGLKLAAYAMVAIAIISTALRIKHEYDLRHTANGADHKLTAIVVTPEASAASEGFILPGELHAYLEASVYARTNGYLKSRHVELGAAVTKGEILAEIDSPETDQQLKQAQADLATAEANYQVAQTTAERYTNLLKTHFVSQQDTDIKLAEANARKAMVASAQANVDRLEKLEGFKRVMAPFDGIVTARNVDIGTLISAGNAEQELFHVADLRKLRVLVQVPQQQALLVKPGLDAWVQIPEKPNMKIPAKLVRTAQAIDPTTHTLMVELEIDNHNNTLLPGGYCEVHLPLSAANSVRVPAGALLFGSTGTRIATVDSNNLVVIKPVSVGQDFGKQVEITSGISNSDKVVVNPWDSITDGQSVLVNDLAATKAAEKDKK